MESSNAVVTREVTVNSTPPALWEHKELGGIFSLSRQIQSGRDVPWELSAGWSHNPESDILTAYIELPQNGRESATKMGSKTKAWREEKERLCLMENSVLRLNLRWQGQKHKRLLTLFPFLSPSFFLLGV